MSHLIVKVCHQGEIKRVAVNLDIPLAELRIKLATLFNMPTGTPVILKYLDDENDLITLGEDEEFAEAVRLARNNNLVLRVHMFLPNQPIPATNFKHTLTHSNNANPAPALLSSQLPLFSSTSASPTAAAAAAAPSLSVIVVERHYFPLSQISQRTATVSNETTALVEKNASEVSSKTAVTSDATALTMEGVARQTQLHVEKISLPAGNVSALSDKTADNCESLARSTSDKVSALADVVAMQMAKHAERAAEANANNTERERHWAIIASDTASRVDELSAALVQRLMSL